MQFKRATPLAAMWREDCGEPRWKWDHSHEVLAMVQARDGGGLAWLSGYGMERSDGLQEI